MATLDLSAQLSGHVFGFLLVFSRIGAGIMTFPGIGESFVPTTLRLAFALALSFIVTSVLYPTLPQAPAQMGDLAMLIVHEIFIGVFFGAILRLLMDALETAGSVISVQLGLSNAMILNPTQGSQSSLSGALLGTLGIALIFITGVDHFFMRGLFDTYSAFPITGSVELGDAAQTYAHLMMQSFLTGIELAAPFLVLGLMLYVALGMIQRMMPQVQLFIVILPLQIWGGIFLFAATITAIAAAWLHFVNDTFAGLAG